MTSNTMNAISVANFDLRSYQDAIVFTENLKADFAPEIEGELTSIAHKHGKIDLYVGDDNLAYFAGYEDFDARVEIFKGGSFSAL